MSVAELAYANPWWTTLWIFVGLAGLPQIIRSLLDPIFLRFEKRVAVAAKKLEAKEDQLTNLIGTMESVLRVTVSTKVTP